MSKRKMGVSTWGVYVLALVVFLGQISWSSMQVELNSWAVASPMGAFLLVLMACRGKKVAFAPILLAMFLAQPVLQLLQGQTLHYSMLVFVALIVGCFAGVGVWMRAAMGKAPNLLALLGGGVLASVLFYVSGNTISWLGSSLYEQSWAGFVRAQWLGLEGYPPAYTFLRAQLLAVVLFVPSCYLVMQLVQRADRRVGRATV